MQGVFTMKRLTMYILTILTLTIVDAPIVVNLGI